MATTSVTDFWKILKSVSAADIAKESERPVSIAVIGTPEHRADAVHALFFEESSPARAHAIAQARPETPFVRQYDTMTTEAGFPAEANLFDVILDLGSSRAAGPAAVAGPVYSVADLGGWEHTLDRVLEDRPELTLALGRSFPVFRRRAAHRVINQTSAANAQFALVTGVTELLPLLAILLPVNSLSDILVLTKNQVMMVLRLAALYGLPVDYKSRMKEVGPILANAFGWRAVARELLGAVPGIGFLGRGAIAYAGTATVGRAAQFYYETGEQITGREAKRLYQQALQIGRTKVKELASAMRNRRNAHIRGRIHGGEQPALPPAKSVENVGSADSVENTVVVDAAPKAVAQP